MGSVQSIVPAVVGGALTLGVAAIVYADARRVDVGRPTLWGAVVFATTAVTVSTYLFVPTVPRPGLLVIALSGPIFYLFEREDAAYGDGSADPQALAFPDESDGPSDQQDSVERAEADDSGSTGR